MKFVINCCHGGFGLSQKAFQWLIDNKNWKVYKLEENEKISHNDRLRLQKEGYHLMSHPMWGPLSLMRGRKRLEVRSDLDIVECVETLKEEASENHANLKIVEANVSIDQLEINEHYGMEILQTIPTRFE